MKDICYKCGVVQEYGTMKDIDEVSFEILCNYCYNMNANNLLDKNMTIDKAKNILRNSGYYVDNLWHIRDVTDGFKCEDEDEAYSVLDEVMESEQTAINIFEQIGLIIEAK